MSLRGTAQKLLSSLTSGQLSNYQAIKNTLTQRFNPKERSVAHRCEFRNKQQGKGESAADFGYTLRRLALLAYPELPYTYLETQVVDQFINGLRNCEMRKKVTFSHPQTLDEAISSAVEFEAVLGCTSIKLHGDSVKVCTLQTVSAKSKSNEYENEEKLTQETITQLIDKQIGNLSRSRNEHRKRSIETTTKTGACYFCKEVGHYVRDCARLSTLKEREERVAKVESDQRKAEVAAKIPAGQDAIHTLCISRHKTRLEKREKTQGKTEKQETVSSQVRQTLHDVYSDMGCLYTDVQVHNVTCMMLIDTGSPVSVLSYAEFSKLGLDELSLQRFETNITTADGNQVEVKGCIPLVFEMGSNTFEQIFVVATVDNLSGMLGMDFLVKYNSTILLEKGILETCQGNFHLSQQRRDSDNVVLSVMNMEPQIVRKQPELVISTVDTVTKDIGQECTKIDEIVDSEHPIRVKLRKGSNAVNRNTTEGDTHSVNDSNEVSVLKNESYEKTYLASTNNATSIKLLIGMTIVMIAMTMLGMIRSDQLVRVLLTGHTDECKISGSNLVTLLHRKWYCQTSRVTIGRPKVWYPP
ncbi:uncharacterized protein LOC110464694 [Mizuhopecten yessoensis]|uniref:uncharacterized protein LOC110464694 n=1 Tax=Mizuhopecten yessoensis TaxID=6573 RepID=UPI000B45793B|nr:uncharacterized protein LOC110464694 [Mizuhopecten yessoensis]